MINKNKRYKKLILKIFLIKNYLQNKQIIINIEILI